VIVYSGGLNGKIPGDFNRRISVIKCRSLTQAAVAAEQRPEIPLQKAHAPLLAVIPYNGREDGSQVDIV
jgi:hypothetical protein